MSNKRMGSFSVPEEVSFNNAPSRDQREIDIALNTSVSLQTPGKSNNSPPFVGIAFGDEVLSSFSNDDIACSQAISIHPMQTSMKMGQESTLKDEEKLMIAGLHSDLVKQPRQRPKKFSCPAEETLHHFMTKAFRPSVKLVGSAGPFLNQDGTFKSYKFYHNVEVGTVIFSTTESIYTLEKGKLLGRKDYVYLTRCGKFIFKKREYVKDLLNAWKLLPHSDFILPLSGVQLAGSGFVYQITKRMDYDLQQARNNKTMVELARKQSKEQWSNTSENFKHIVRSILQGVIHLNRNNYQHYDIKEDNIFTNKPCGCKCDNILECICSKKWTIKIGDFDTLSKIDCPQTWICGTKFYRPPECEGAEFSPKYKEPTFDSWSILVVILHFCCGTARNTSNKQAQELPWLKNQECHYAKERRTALCDAALTNVRLKPMAQFAIKCLDDNYKTRPTPEKMLEMWDTLHM